MAALIGISMKPTAGSDYTCQVPLDLLAEDGVPPEKGDSVSYSVDGTVQSVDATTATIKLDAINGQPLSGASGAEGAEGQQPASEEAGAGESTADMGSRLKKGAAANSLGLF
jgi:hypothetical protein